MDKLKKAELIDDIYTTFLYRPLQIDELDTFYVENAEVRGGVPVRLRLSRYFDKKTGDNQHFLLVGYKGTGKSTELNHLQRDIQDKYMVINFSVMQELDPQHLNYIELFIVAMEQLFALAKENDLKISREYIKNISHWLQTKEIVEIREKYNIGAEAEVGAEAKVDLPFLVKFFGKFKMSAKSSRSLKETIKENIEPKLSDLIEHCNLLINEIKLDLQRVGKKDLVIIIEDLDKVPLDRAEDLFFNYANQLTALKSNMVFTFPITTFYNTKFNTIRQYFSQVLELPMIKVRNKDQSIFTDGVNLLKKIVEKRMVLALFEKPELLENLILKSGGCIRDLFRLITEAAEHAIDYARTTITEADCHSSLLSLKRDYSNTLADNPKKDIKVETYFDTLVQIAKDPTKTIDNSEEVLDLRQNLCLLGYNGESWCDVHPIVKDILTERKLWNGKQKQ